MEDRRATERAAFEEQLAAHTAACEAPAQAVEESEQALAAQHREQAAHEERLTALDRETAADEKNATARSWPADHSCPAKNRKCSVCDIES